jgi:peptide/nickel transport system permease protein
MKGNAVASRSIGSAHEPRIIRFGPIAAETLKLALTIVFGFLLVALMVFLPNAFSGRNANITAYLDAVRTYLLDVLRGDLGKTLSGRPVARELGYAMQHTFQLLAISLAVTLPLGLAWGALLATARRGVVGALVFGLNTLFNALPSFVILLLAMQTIATITFRTGFRLLPIQGYALDEHLILPVSVLALRGGAYLARAVQIAQDDILRQDWIRAARAKGLGGFALWRRHVLPALRAPLLAATLGTTRVVVAGMVIVDYMVGWRGLPSTLLRPGGGIVRPAEETLATGAAAVLLLFFVGSDTLGRIAIRRVSQAQAGSLGHAGDSRFNMSLLIGAGLALVICGCALLAPVLAPYAPDQTLLRYNGTRVVPAPYPPGTPGLLLGSDANWRDMLTRMLYGARFTVLFCGVAALLRVALGVLIGVPAGWYQRWSRFVDVVAGAWSSVPSLFYALVPITQVNFGNMGLTISTVVVLVVLSTTGWAEIAVHCRAAVQQLRGAAFVEAAYTTGLSRARVLWRHIFPNLRGLILVEASFAMGAALLLVAELGFLGAFIGGIAPEIALGGGVEMNPVYAEWGSMLGVGLRQRSAIWLLLEPALAFTISILAFNLLAEGLRRRR